MSPELESISRIRTAASWLRRTGKHIDSYPKRDAMSTGEQFDAKQFATGAYPWPSKWTVRLFRIAKAD